MKKILAVFVAIGILWIMSAVSVVLKSLMEVSRENTTDIGQFQFVIMGLIPILPLLIAVWLIKLSWKKITAKKIENEN